MSAHEDPSRRVGDRWARATDAELPPLDVARGRDRLLAANETIAQARARRARRAWTSLAAAALIGAFAVGFFVRSRTGYTFTLDGKSAVVGARLEANDLVERRIRFSEGSTIALAPDSIMAVSEVDGRGAI